MEKKNEENKALREQVVQQTQKALKILKEKHTEIEAKERELRKYYKIQKEAFQKLYEKKVQIIDDKVVIKYIHNGLADGKKKKTLNKLLEAPSVQDTIKEVAKYINDRNLSLKDWALTLPYKELTSFTNLLHNTTDPLQYVNSFINVCVNIHKEFTENLPTYNNSLAYKNLRKIVSESYYNQDLLLIEKIKDRINEIAKKPGKLSANKKALKEQLDKEQKKLIGRRNTWR